MGKNIPEELVEKVRNWLGEDGINFFKNCLEKEGKIAPVLVIGGMPHPVHFREGMKVRNFMRFSGLCNNWTDHDFDNNWITVVEKTLNLP